MTSRTFIAEKRAIRYIRGLEAVAARARLMNPAEMMRLITVALVALISTPAVADVPGSGDNALIPRYPGSEIIDYKVASFDEYRMAVGPRVGGKVESQKIEGKVTRIKYRLTPTERSDLEVFRNYERALAEAGFEVVFRCTDETECGTSFFYQIIYKINRMPIENIDSRYLVATLTRPGEGDMTVALAVQRRKLPSTKEMTVDVALDIVEAESMDVGMELKLADEMSREIGAQGRAVLYGIFPCARPPAALVSTTTSIFRSAELQPSLQNSSLRTVSSVGGCQLTASDTLRRRLRTTPKRAVAPTAGSNS
jgi:hypothetical protein